jgi:nitroimidazol reductase NimA-like FMN-containing flavoprotein (pyridoxamine 5'-phosphate oxidase superfamily)
MRRSEREIESRADIDAVIRHCQVCRLGLADGDEPYVVPLCFGYDGETLYFHCAHEGRKVDIMRRNSRVCFEFDIVEQITEGATACGWGMRFQSVIGRGVASVVEDLEEKRRALALIMAQYAGDRPFEFPEDAVDQTAIVRVKIDSITGKQTKRD